MSDLTILRRTTDWWEAHRKTRWAVGWVSFVVISAVLMHLAGVR